ncbi:MAG: hypothetical protein LBG60_10575 [Bifidobacteriaceae bacterium]|nr:hypothetical protein [Bifidobacteriaceae bacterium]
MMQAVLEEAPAAIVPLYHYTPVETLWNILESEEMWATHARFSNDAKEIKSGVKLVFGEEGPAERRFNPFIVSFCSKEDLLSQWREYARAGVAVEFAFPDSFTLTVLDRKKAKGAEAHTGGGSMRIDGCRPYPVFYVHPSGSPVRLPKESREALEAREFRGRLTPAGATGGSRTDGIPPGNPDEESAQVLFPYIKDSGFEEESEWRLVADLTTVDRAALRKAVDYRDDPKLPLKRPYVRLRFGAPVEDNNTVRVRVHGRVIAAWNEFQETQLGRERPQPIKEALEEALPTGPAIEFEEFGERAVGAAAESAVIDEVFVSGKAAEQVFGAVENLLVDLPAGGFDSGEDGAPALGSKIAIWSENHWPIRSIRVGPQEGQADVKESIEHYCSTHWWLRYVKVEESKVPYRPPRN